MSYKEEGDTCMSYETKRQSTLKINSRHTLAVGDNKYPRVCRTYGSRKLYARGGRRRKPEPALRLQGPWTVGNGISRDAKKDS